MKRENAKLKSISTFFDKLNDNAKKKGFFFFIGITATFQTSVSVDHLFGSVCSTWVALIGSDEIMNHTRQRSNSHVLPSSSSSPFLRNEKQKQMRSKSVEKQRVSDVESSVVPFSSSSFPSFSSSFPSCSSLLSSSFSSSPSSPSYSSLLSSASSLSLSPSSSSSPSSSCSFGFPLPNATSTVPLIISRDQTETDYQYVHRILKTYKTYRMDPRDYVHETKENITTNISFMDLCSKLICRCMTKKTSIHTQTVSEPHPDLKCYKYLYRSILELKSSNTLFLRWGLEFNSKQSFEERWKNIAVFLSKFQIK